MTTAPVLVVDDHELVRTTLAFALNAQAIPTHQCTATTRKAILDEAALLSPGLVLLDLDLGRDVHGGHLDGVDLIGELRAKGWNVLVVSGSGNREQLAAAIAAGAVGVVSKTTPFPTLRDTVIDATCGRPVMSEQDRQQWLELDQRYKVALQQWRRRMNRLTSREHAVLDRLAAGCRAAAIAEEFVVSLATVRSQIRSILTKLEVSSQLEAVALLRTPGTEGSTQTR